jgi:hypothetical protein
MDKNVLQEILEREACRKNGGMCESYNYCKFCKEPKIIDRISDTPCADAYIDMKDVTNVLKKHQDDKEYIKVNTEKIKIWRKELNEKWNDDDYLNEWYSDLKSCDTFGMPKRKGGVYSVLENETINRENIRKKISDFIELEEERLRGVKRRYYILEKALDSLSEKDRFIIDCKYGKSKLSFNDTILSYKKKYNHEFSIDQIKKKMAVIKRKIFEKICKK